MHQSQPRTATGATDQTVGPSPEAIEALATCFLKHAEQVGFVLSKDRFIQSVRQSSPTLAPALTNAACMWGTRFSCEQSLVVHEPILLSRAVQGVADCLAHVSKYHITHVIQAEVLLATYFYSMGRSVEGRYHTSAAVALAVILQSHNAGTLSTGGPYHHVQSHTIGASPPTDDEEIHHILWSVYILDRTWSVATGSQLGAPLAINCGTPRPLAINTLQNDAFVQADPSTADNALIREHINCTLGIKCAVLVLRAKVAGLYERASRTTSHYSDSTADPGTTLEISTLENTINSFFTSIPRAESSLRREDDSSVLLVHTLAHAATAQLYRGCHEPQTLAGQKALTAAMSAALLLNDRHWEEYRFFDPILSVLWGDIARVLKAVSRNYPEHDHGRIALNALQNVQRVMTTSSRAIPNMALQLARIQQEVQSRRPSAV